MAQISQQRPVREGLHRQQGASIINDDSAAYRVSNYSLTLEVEADTHALCWIAPRCDSRTTHAMNLIDSMSLLRKVKNGMGRPDWNVFIVDIHL